MAVPAILSAPGNGGEVVWHLELYACWANDFPSQGRIDLRGVEAFSKDPRLPASLQSVALGCWPDGTSLGNN